MTKFYKIGDHYFMVAPDREILHVSPECINNISLQDFMQNPANFENLIHDEYVFKGDQISSDTFLDALNETSERLNLHNVYDELAAGEHG